jgi:hypothetical protein
MPGLDQTGPAGYGNGTGRGMGPCGRGMAYGRGSGQGFGRRSGRGRGFCWNLLSEPNPVSKEAQKQLLEAEKTEIERRLTTLE